MTLDLQLLGGRVTTYKSNINSIKPVVTQRDSIDFGLKGKKFRCLGSYFSRTMSSRGLSSTFFETVLQTVYIRVELNPLELIVLEISRKGKGQKVRSRCCPNRIHQL